MGCTGAIRRMGWISTLVSVLACGGKTNDEGGGSTDEGASTTAVMPTSEGFCATLASGAGEHVDAAGCGSILDPNYCGVVDGAQCRWYPRFFDCEGVCGESSDGACVEVMKTQETGCFGDDGRFWRDTPSGVQFIQIEGSLCFEELVGWNYCGDDNSGRPGCGCVW